VILFDDEETPMTILQPGLVHTPVTPFAKDSRIDYAAYGKLLEFHLAHGAEALALPMHAGESVSLTDDEQRALLDYALGQVRGRVPVLAHVSDSGTGIAAARARIAGQAGAAAVIATTPYYWTPPPAMLLEHFAQIGAAVKIPFFVYHAPEEMGGVKVNTDLVLKLIGRLENFAGLIDSSLDWQFMINVISNARRVRPAFQLLSGTEYMISARAIGATGMFSSLAGIAPILVRRLYDLCRSERYREARGPQEAVAELRQIVKQGGGAGLKEALRALGRDCGIPRPPLLPLDADACGKFAAELAALAALHGEPRGWPAGRG
jgi:4-hydroxy-tetrahydrodipicolinate synthase